MTIPQIYIPPFCFTVHIFAVLGKFCHIFTQLHLRFCPIAGNFSQFLKFLGIFANDKGGWVNILPGQTNPN